MPNENLLMILEHNVETGEVVERPMTDEELAAHEKIMAAQEAENAAKTAHAAEKAALLEKLGITEDEAKLLLS